MIGKIFITSSGYDPQLGKQVKDPYLGTDPTLGACRPDVRRQLNKGDHIFVISGKVRGVQQFVMGGFEIESKIDVREAYDRFPELRLRKLPSGEIDGNIIVDAEGKQHRLDHHDHKTFDRRIKNYVVGKNLLTLDTEDQIAEGRQQTLPILCDVFQKNGNSPFEVVGHYGTRMTEKQIYKLREWLAEIKGTPAK
ncbi:MAG: hypothetical protein V4671_06745 [Armatimonadota bacterium]